MTDKSHAANEVKNGRIESGRTLPVEVVTKTKQIEHQTVNNTQIATEARRCKHGQRGCMNSLLSRFTISTFLRRSKGLSQPFTVLTAQPESDSEWIFSATIVHTTKPNGSTSSTAPDCRSCTSMCRSSQVKMIMTLLTIDNISTIAPMILVIITLRWIAFTIVQVMIDRGPFPILSADC